VRSQTCRAIRHVNNSAVARNQLRSASDSVKIVSEHAYMAAEHARNASEQLQVESGHANVAVEHVKIASGHVEMALKRLRSVSDL